MKPIHRAALIALPSLGLVALAVLASNPNPPGTPTVTVPMYGAGLAPQQQPPPAVQGVTAEQFAHLEAKVDKILKILEDALKEEAVPPPAGGVAPGVGPPPGVPPAAPPAGRGGREALVLAAATKCASCHHVNVADQRGGGFRLFTPQGLFAPLTPQKRTQVVKRLGTDDPQFRMPPPLSAVKLTEEERAALLAEFDVPK